MPKRLKDHFIFEKQFLLNMLAIAVPIALQNIISFGVAMMDSVMLGGLGDKAISAANLGGQPFSLLMSIGFGLSSGGSVLIAQYWGRGDVARIRTVMRLSMQIVFTASSLMTLVCLLFPQQVMGLYSSEAEIVAAAAQYLQLVALSYLPYSISNNYIMSLRAVEKVTVSAAIYGTSFFVNVFFNYVFIFGAFGAPALGVRGAAVGTILARCSELLLVTIYMYAKEDTIGFRFSDCFRLKNEMIQDYTRHSLPVLGNELLWGLGISVTAAIIGRIGSVFVTANSIAAVLNQLALVSVIGVGNAAAVITGKLIGEGRMQRAKRAANTILLGSVFVGMFNCAMIFILRPIFLSFYRITPEAYEAAYTVMGVLALLHLSLAIDITCIIGILRGGGDTKTAFAFDCGALWLVSVPMGVLSGLVWGWPVPLVYVMLKLDSPIKTILSLIRLKSGAWIRNVTNGA
ncbi:MAG TPA: MATE family efflux transporter [Candidatus Ruthenibacterium merdavium]|uniref:MATE family efflux transporter n=1 Tax=Candidatus Ruthenibacterium merdavium TaxID=2838752 RepID=A0A9D2Q4M7_9FIRM|nr:MATE family efflux transporter [Candidatus Ruthenibacterium merdavium]